MHIVEHAMNCLQIAKINKQELCVALFASFAMDKCSMWRCKNTIDEKQSSQNTILLLDENVTIPMIMCIYIYIYNTCFLHTYTYTYEDII